MRQIQDFPLAEPNRIPGLYKQDLVKDPEKLLVLVKRSHTLGGLPGVLSNL